MGGHACNRVYVAYCHRNCYDPACLYGTQSYMYDTESQLIQSVNSLDQAVYH